MKKSNIESRMEVDHFIMLDATDVVSRNVIAKSHHGVQIVYPSIKNSYIDINTIMSRMGSVSKSEEKIKHLFTITLNLDADYYIRRSGIRLRK